MKIFETYKTSFISVINNHIEPWNAFIVDLPINIKYFIACFIDLKVVPQFCREEEESVHNVIIRRQIQKMQLRFQAQRINTDDIANNQDNVILILSHYSECLQIPNSVCIHYVNYEMRKEIVKGRIITKSMVYDLRSLY